MRSLKISQGNKISSSAASCSPSSGGSSGLGIYSPSISELSVGSKKSLINQDYIIPVLWYLFKGERIKAFYVDSFRQSLLL